MTHFTAALIDTMKATENLDGSNGSGQPRAESSDQPARDQLGTQIQAVSSGSASTADPRQIHEEHEDDMAITEILDDPRVKQAWEEKALLAIGPSTLSVIILSLKLTVCTKMVALLGTMAACCFLRRL